MSMTISPHQGVGPIAFGMSRAEVGRAMGITPIRARRNVFAAADYDFFETLGMFVYYDTQDICAAVEFTRLLTVLYEGYSLFAHPATEVRKWAIARDPELEQKDGFESEVMGLGMYAPSIDEPDLEEEGRSAPAESFLIFRPGYREEERKRLESIARQ